MSETISRLEKSKLEWQDLLSAEAYKVLFKEATEPAGSSTVSYTHLTLPTSDLV